MALGSSQVDLNMCVVPSFFLKTSHIASCYIFEPPLPRFPIMTQFGNVGYPTSNWTYYTPIAYSEDVCVSKTSFFITVQHTPLEMRKYVLLAWITSCSTGLSWFPFFLFFFTSLFYERSALKLNHNYERVFCLIYRPECQIKKSLRLFLVVQVYFVQPWWDVLLIKIAFFLSLLTLSFVLHFMICFHRCLSSVYCFQMCIYTRVFILVSLGFWLKMPKWQCECRFLNRARMKAQHISILVP